MRVSILRSKAHPAARAAPTEIDMQRVSIRSSFFFRHSIGTGALAALVAGGLAACNDEDSDTTTAASVSSTTSTGGGGQGGSGATGGGGGGGGTAVPLPCLDASAYADAFELKDPGLCVIARYEAPMIVGFDENYVETAPTWGRHGGPLTLKQSGTTFTLTRWSVPQAAKGSLSESKTVGPLDLKSAGTPEPLFINAAAVDLPFGDATAVGWTEFGTTKGKLYFVGESAILGSFGISGLYAAAGLGTSTKARLLTASTSAVGTEGTAIGLYANDFCASNGTLSPCIANGGTLQNGLVAQQGDASGPVAVDAAGNAFTVFPSIATGKQKLVGYASATIAPEALHPAATELATLDGSGTSLAAMAPTATEDGLAFFQPSVMFVPGDVIVQKYAVSNGTPLAAKGSATPVLVPKAMGADVRLMVDEQDRVWAGLRVDPSKPGSAFFVIDRKSAH